MVTFAIALCEHGWNLVVENQNGSVQLHGLTEDDLLRNIKQAIHDAETGYHVRLASILSTCRQTGNA
jgi:hypothetical protein